MYVPHAYREDDTEKLVEFVRAHSFATLVSVLDGVPFASHIPIVVGYQDGLVRLTGHVAKANPHWKAFAHGESLAIFTGPHAYIAPSLYEKRESVPTWNYIAVHAYGLPRILTLAESRERLTAMLAHMIDAYDPSYKDQWNEQSDRFREGMLNGIVGFEMTVTRLEGKYKLSQNRGTADQRTVAHALLQSADPTIAGVGEAMREVLESGGRH